MAGNDAISAGETGALPEESESQPPAPKQGQPRPSIAARLRSKLAALWERPQRRDRWPRSWWYPKYPQPRPGEDTAGTDIQNSYAECVATVRRTMLVLLGFCLFAIVVTFGTPDSSLIASEAKVKLPFAESDIEFLGFLVAAPALLIVLALYLHIFDTRRRELERAFNVSWVPALFTLDRPLPKLLTSFIFYWLVPLVLVAITWKASARLWWGLPLLAVTITVTAVLIWMQIRRCGSERRLLKTLPLWAALVGLVSIACFAGWETVTGLVGPRAWYDDALRRPLNLFRADLSNKWLANADLRNADLRSANLQNADLSGATLEGARLAEANLQGTDLERAKLQGANLAWANLQSAILDRANLQGAILALAKLQGADLSQADLQGAMLALADLQGADLYESNLQGANLSRADLRGADLFGAELHGTVLSRAKLQGADLSRAKLQGADLSQADLRGAGLIGAELHGADLRQADLRGADLLGAQLHGADSRQADLHGANLSGAWIWLTSVPSNLDHQSPAPLAVADLNMLPLAALSRAILEEELRASITDSKLLGRVIDRLDPILRDDPPEWKDEDAWRAYKARAEPPGAEELAVYFGKLACEDDQGYIAEGLARRAADYARGRRRDLAVPIAKELLGKECNGVLALSEGDKARLKELAGTEIDTPSTNRGLAD